MSNTDDGSIWYCSATATSWAATATARAATPKTLDQNISSNLSYEGVKRVYVCIERGK